jgi:peptide/nickel transport system substrate-binding protein
VSHLVPLVDAILLVAVVALLLARSRARSRHEMASLAPCAGVIVVLLASACAAAAAEIPKAGRGPVGKAVVALSSQTTGTVDPVVTGGNATDFPNSEALYNRLLETPRDSLELRPGIATKWTISPDWKTVEFEIRRGVRFHNGDLLTPEDVVFTVERAARLGNPGTKAYFEQFLQGAKVKGNAVVFQLKKPDWTFLSRIGVTSAGGGDFSIVPKKYIERVGDEGFLKAPVGTGPFKFVSWARHEYLELEAVDHEHFLWQPGVKRLRYVTVPEETTRLAMIRAGEADLAQISVTSVRALAGDSQVRLLRVPNVGGLRLFLFGQEDPNNPLSKVEVRQALSLALDRQAIADKVYQGYARPSATGIWNPDVPGFPSWAKKPPVQDLKTAKALLAKAGYPDGKGLKITLHNYEYGQMPLWTQVAPVIASQWEKLGIQVQLRQWEWGSWAPAARTGKLDPVSVGTHLANMLGEKGNVGDLIRSGLYAHAAGTARGAHPQLAAWAEKFDSEVDAAKRDALLKKILEYDRDNVVFMPVVVQDGLWAAGPRLLDYAPRRSIAIGNMWTIKVKP